MVRVTKNGNEISIVLETEDEINTMWHSLNSLYIQERYEACYGIHDIQYHIFDVFDDEYCPDEV
jgi:hypothetical protein